MKVAVIGSRSLSVPNPKNTFGGHYGDLSGRGARHRYVSERIHTGEEDQDEKYRHSAPLKRNITIM